MYSYCELHCAYSEELRENLANTQAAFTQLQQRFDANAKALQTVTGEHDKACRDRDEAIKNLEETLTDLDTCGAQ